MASQIQSKMPEKKDEKKEQMDQILGKIKNKLLVMSGKGGVGKSSVAANLAVLLAEKGFKVGLMDIDVHGPSIAKIMGITGLLEIDTEKQLAKPATYGENLKIVSMQSFMREADQAVIWRGPAKSGMIQQFITTVDWGELDFLIVDAPPGTGDEPLTIIQTIPDSKAIVVTTPQDVALSDVRKSINFCKTVKMEILGLLENMGPFQCPHCSEEIAIFKKGGGKQTAFDMGIKFLGTLPYNAEVLNSGDSGNPVITKDKTNSYTQALEACAEQILSSL
ncbi:MAG: Mrp/NBP35 family ATP-binding protein [Desulforegulaceae bacterium]|nr:Mrp/NBP35 family ATP-binding protein [Desulforegulaceae bacterium]